MAFKRWLIGIKGPECAKKTFPHTIKFWPCHLRPHHKLRLIRPGFVFPVLSSLCRLQPQIYVLGWDKYNLTSSAVVAPPLQDLTCSFWNVFLLSTVVTRGYVSYRGLSASSNKSSRSPWTSLINKVFPSTEMLPTGCVLFFCTSLNKL